MFNKIYPSLISGDLLNLERQITLLEPHCAGFHLDVMDFHFVPNLTWGPDFIDAIRKVTKQQLWIDLLVDQPLPYLERLRLRHGDIVSIHYESLYDNNIFYQLHMKSWKASLALDPKTPIEVIIPFLDVIDHVLLMSVVPGFSGQEFVHESVEKLKKLHALRKEHKAEFTIGMDGGLNAQTLPLVLPYGVDTLAIASGIFNAQDPVEELKTLGGLRI
jgi:ribulose-phosphate 3-epimerase